MADDYEAEHPDEEHEGGPVKSFLEHLEDLRWVLIKSLTALGVAMLLCLIAGNYVVDVLKWPLTRVHIKYPMVGSLFSKGKSSDTERQLLQYSRLWIDVG